MDTFKLSTEGKLGLTSICGKGRPFTLTRLEWGNKDSLDGFNGVDEIFMGSYWPIDANRMNPDYEAGEVIYYYGLSVSKDVRLYFFVPLTGPGVYSLGFKAIVRNKDQSVFALEHDKKEIIGTFEDFIIFEASEIQSD